MAKPPPEVLAGKRKEDAARHRQEILKNQEAARISAPLERIEDFYALRHVSYSSRPEAFITDMSVSASLFGSGSSGLRQRPPAIP